MIRCKREIRKEKRTREGSTDNNEEELKSGVK